MHRATVITVVVAVSVVLLGMVSGQQALLPPERPHTFFSPEDLRQYLKALNEYYAIVGRPRFGRSVDVNEKVTGQAKWTKE